MCLPLKFFGCCYLYESRETYLRNVNVFQTSEGFMNFNLKSVSSALQLINSLPWLSTMMIFWPMHVLILEAGEVSLLSAFVIKSDRSSLAGALHIQVVSKWTDKIILKFERHMKRSEYYSNLCIAPRIKRQWISCLLRRNQHP